MAPHTAQRAGRVVEDILAAVLTAAGVTFDRQVIVGQTIYGWPLHADFVVQLPSFSAGLIVESKWQDVGGSIDEKFPYLVMNLRQQTLPSVVIVHGGGCRNGALEWLRAQCDDHLIAVYDLEGFISWVLRLTRASGSLIAVSMEAHRRGSPWTPP